MVKQSLTDYSVSLSVLCMLVVTVLSTPLHAQDKEEVIIHGQNRQPTRGTFDYQGDTEPRSDRTFTEMPSVETDEGFDSPKMKRDLNVNQRDRSPGDPTKLNADTGMNYFWPAIGLLALVAIAAG